MTVKHYSLFLVMSFILLTGCASDGTDETIETAEKSERSVEELYNEAADALDAENYAVASKLFEDVEREHPYSQWATKAQLMSAFASYQADNYDEAILAINRFIELHPGNEDIDYAYYLRALAYYEQISDVARDQAMTEEALKALDALILRFPDSEYVRDSKLKRDLTLDHLAGKEMEIGRYYLNRNQVNGAINRFRNVVQDYQTTTHVPEALHRLVESYLILGLRTEAARTASVLGHNFPGSKWYEDSYTVLDPELRAQFLDDRSFIDKTVDSLFRPD